jgi:hypothetical protein
MDQYKCDFDVMCGFYQQPLDGKWAEHVTAYHITQAENVSSILENGLIAKECKATRYGDHRRKAVYLFAAKGDAYDQQIRKFLFDNQNDLAVVKVTVPYSAFINFHDDGLFNMSCECSDGSYPTAIQYTENIPANWIQECK